MFSLERVVAKLKNVNPRAEKCGEDTELGCDLKFTLALSNDFLDNFDKGLKAFLYVAPDQADDLLHLPGSLTKLRYPLLGNLTHGYEGVGYLVKVEHGVDGNIELYDCKINGFKLACQEGGTLQLTMRVQCNPEEEDVGKLCTHIENEVTITVTPPGPKTAEELFDNKGQKVK